MPKSLVHAQLQLNTARGVPMPAWTPYVGLYVGDPLAGGAEVVGGGYVRRLIAFAAPTGFLMANASPIVFPAPTAFWGLLTHAALLDALVGGNPRATYLMSGTDTDRTVGVGTAPVTLGIGTLIYSES